MEKVANRMKFAYPAEKFSGARRLLMLPHPNGETEDIARVFELCSRGLQDITSEDLDEDAQESFEKLQELMDTSRIEDPAHRGKWTIKAENLTDDEKYELSRVVDELSHWFYRQFWRER